MNKLCLGCICVSVLLSIVAKSQPGIVPEIGRPFPQMVFQDVRHGGKGDFAIAGQRGKWLIINFWSLGCTSCFTAFRKINEIRKVYDDEVQFLLVGKKDRDFNINIESIYQTISANMKLTVPATFDSALMRAWNIMAYPHMYIIDPDGVLRYITDGRDLSVDKIGALVEKRPVEFYPLLVPTHEFGVSAIAEDKTIHFAGIISESTGETQHTDDDPANFDNLAKAARMKGWRASTVPLYALYNYAYFGAWSWSRYDTARYGKIYPYPILEMADTSTFRFDYSVAPATGVFNCFIKLPADRASSQNLMHELSLTFGYPVREETRLMPAWELRAKPWTALRIKTKGGRAYASPGSAAGGFILRNQSVDELTALLTAHLPGDSRTIFLNATGISHFIDFEIKGDMTDVDVVRKMLAKSGMSLVQTRRLMKVLIIGDPKKK